MKAGNKMDRLEKAVNERKRNGHKNEMTHEIIRRI
jgi:hypothetical protein